MSRSASLYGISTWMCRPCFVSARYCSAAHVPAMFLPSSLDAHRVRMSAAPASSSPVSTPMSAAGSTPTGVSTLNRPPTFDGISSAAMLSDCAMVRSAPFLGSVTSTSCLVARSSPSAAFRRARITRYCAIVSAVPPDLEMTTNRLRRRSSRASSAEMFAGSTLSSTWRRGLPPRAASSSRFHCGGRSAVRSAMGPSADPPMPSTTTSVSPLAPVCDRTPFT